MAMRFDRLKTLSGIFASLFLVALASSSCGGSAAPDPDPPLPAPNDAGKERPDALEADAGNQPGDDGASSDAGSEKAGNDDQPDGGLSSDALACSCTTDAGNGFTSLPCFCASNAFSCSSYREAIACLPGGRPSSAVVETYADCPYVNVRIDAGLFSHWRVYSTVTEELVGAMRENDTASIRCDGSRVARIEAGINPIALGCQPASRTIPCDGDAGVDADAADTKVDTDASTNDADVDVDCNTCTPDEDGVLGIQSLSCFCAQSSCPIFDVAMDQCPTGPIPNLNRIETYENCNLVVVVASNGLGSSLYVYDATTHEFMGGAVAADYPGHVCGMTPVFGYRAGTFPPANCPLTKSVPRCTDAGK